MSFNFKQKTREGKKLSSPLTFLEVFEAALKQIKVGCKWK